MTFLKYFWIKILQRFITNLEIAIFLVKNIFKLKYRYFDLTEILAIAHTKTCYQLKNIIIYKVIKKA